MAVTAGKGRTSRSNGARLLNLFAEYQSDTRRTIIYGTPGTARFAVLPTYPVKAMVVMGNVLYAVSGSGLYQVNWNGNVTLVGSVVMAGPRVSIATNGTHLVFVDGLKGYAYSPSAGMVEFSGDGWYPASTVTYQDGYFIFNRKSTGQFFISDLLSITLDPTMWATAERAPDNAECVISDLKSLWIFGPDGGEVWYNSGDTDFPFERISGAYIEIGILAPSTAVSYDNSIFWLGSDRSIYRTNGYSPQRISTEAVEHAINAAQIDDAFAYAYTEEGHRFYVITFPSLRMTWCYDMTTGGWHERGHYEHGRHHSNCFCFAYGKNLVGDFQSGTIYVMDMDVYDDEGAPIVREMIPPQLMTNDFVTMYALELNLDQGENFSRTTFELASRRIEQEGGGGLLFENGRAVLMESDAERLIANNMAAPQVMMQFSDDNQKTWSKERFKRLGSVGRYDNRVRWGPLGRFRQRHLKFRITDPIPVVINWIGAEYG